MKSSIDQHTIGALLLDIDGVLYVGDQPVEGAIETLRQLKAAYPVRFITNTTTKSRLAVAQKLQSLGFDAKEGEIFSALDALHGYAKAADGGAYVLVHPSVKEAFADLETEPVKSVLLGDAREVFTYEALNRAFGYLHQGARLVAAAKNRYFKDKNSQLALDMGGYVALLEYASGQEAFVVGKPEPAFFHQAASAIGVHPSKVLVVGDDVESDVLGAINAGMPGALVQTGKYRPQDNRRLPPEAALIPSFSHLPRLLGL